MLAAVGIPEGGIAQPARARRAKTAKIAATARDRGEPKFLPIDVSETIAQKHPLYESEEIPGSTFSSSPARPGEKIETVSINHLIVARRSGYRKRWCFRCNQFERRIFWHVIIEHFGESGPKHLAMRRQSTCELGNINWTLILRRA